jgi:hypothetical protein
MSAIGRRACLWAALASLVAVAGCSRRATQLLVVVESDLAPARIACVEVEAAPVDGAGEVRRHTFVIGAGEPALAIPFSFGVTPPGGVATRRVELAVSAHAAADCEGTPTVTRRVRSGFLAEQSLRLPVFLSADCEAVTCAPDQTCDYGTCVAVPDLDPGTLVVTEPGQELLDAGGLDAAVEDDAGGDAGSDAGPGAVPDAGTDGGGLSRPRPAATLEVEQLEAMDAHGHLYPVGGTSGAVLVAGVTSRDPGSLDVALAFDGGSRDAGPDAALDAGLPAESATFILGELGHDGRAWRARWLDAMRAVPPYPVVQRMVAVEGGGYLACGTGSGPFELEGVSIAGGAASWPFLLRLDAAGHLVRFAILDVDARDLAGLDAAVEDGGVPAFSARAFCTDLEIDGDVGWVAVQAWGGVGVQTRTGPSGSTSTALFGAVVEDRQSLLLYRLRGLLAGLEVDTPTAISHADAGVAQVVLGRDGSPFFVRSLRATEVFVALQGDAIDPTGLAGGSGPGEPLVARLDGDLARYARAPVSATSGRMRAHLRGAAVLDRMRPFVAVTIHAEGEAGPVRFAGARVPDELVTADVTFLLELDPDTGDVLHAVRAPSAVEAGVDDGAASFSCARCEALSSGALTTSEDGYVLHASSAADGEVVERAALRVSSAVSGVDAGRPLDVLDPVLGIVPPAGEGLVWQWADRPERDDWRLTHVVATGPWVAVAGYVEDQSRDTGGAWRRERSFFEILPR